MAPPPGAPSGSARRPRRAWWASLRPGDRFDRLEDALVGGAAAQVAVHAGDDLLAGGLGVPEQQSVGAHDHAGGAESALHAAALDEPFLERMELPAARQALDRGDRLPAHVAHRDLA